MDGGERAVIFDRFRGILPEVVSEGTHFRVPWVQTPHIMDIRTRPRSISSVTGTKGERPAQRLPSYTTVGMFSAFAADCAEPLGSPPASAGGPGLAWHRICMHTPSHRAPATNGRLAGAWHRAMHASAAQQRRLAGAGALNALHACAHGHAFALMRSWSADIGHERTHSRCLPLQPAPPNA